MKMGNRFLPIDEKLIPSPWKVKHAGSVPYLELNYKGVYITMEKRPSYCDRGNWIAKITEMGPLYLDISDGWPRYYFDVSVAFTEIAAFLKKRSELAPARK